MKALFPPPGGGLSRNREREESLKPGKQHCGATHRRLVDDREQASGRRGDPAASCWFGAIIWKLEPRRQHPSCIIVRSGRRR